MKMLIADNLDESGVRELRDIGYDVTFDASLKDDKLRDAIAAVHPSVLIVRGTKVTAEMIEAANNLTLIIRAGAGYNSIDVAAASRRGIAVANCPGKNAVAVAELTIGLILSLDRRLVDNTIDLRAGHWKKKEYGKSRGLKGRVLGVIGTGEIGKAVIRRARALEMEIVAYGRSLTDEMAAALDVTRCATPADVAARCDVFTIHVAANPDTRGMIGADVLDRLAPGSTVINTSRAEVLDYEALAAAIRDRGIRAGLDVYPGEPGGGEADFRPAILDSEGIVYGAHHIGASTDQAQAAIAAEAVRIASVFATTGHVPNCVNIQTRSPARWQMTVRHFNRVGVLARVLDRISEAGINVEEMTNTIYEGHEAAVASIRLDVEPKEEVVAQIAEMKDRIIRVEVRPVE